ncbi:MAG TPA: glycosyltransferase family 39 protein [Bacteroidota bacterium]
MTLPVVPVMSTRGMKVPLLIAGASLLLMAAFHNSYGYFRDELYYIACSDHLAFGYVDQPPLSIALLALWRYLFGDSLHAIRLLAALAVSVTSFLTALIARRLGGGGFSLWLSALSVVAAHTLLGSGRTYSMNPLDILLWTAALYIGVEILAGGSPKLWLPFGLVVGLGLLNKYSVGFMCAGLAGGLLLTPHRKHLVTGKFWAGALIALLVFLPHIIWEISKGFPTLEFMHNASQFKNAKIGLWQFVGGQFNGMNYINGPLWVVGLGYFFLDGEGSRFRPLAWMYVIVFIIMITGNGKVYYLSAAYPVLLAGGAVFLEKCIAGHSTDRARDRAWQWLKVAYPALLVVWMLVGLPFTLPILPVEKFIEYEKLLGLMPKAEERSSVGELPQFYADQFGWEELTAAVAKIYNSLTPAEQNQCVIFVRNYGEAGAIDFFGKKYGLPHALCAHNSYWMWGPGERTGNIAIIVGHDRSVQDNMNDLNRRYKHVELAGTTESKYSMPYENGRLLFLCREMNTTFQLLWPEERFYI